MLTPEVPLPPGGPSGHHTLSHVSIAALLRAKGLAEGGCGEDGAAHVLHLGGSHALHPLLDWSASGGAAHLSAYYGEPWPVSVEADLQFEVLPDVSWQHRPVSNTLHQALQAW
jgi:hypothetical protein